jgi:hypothetical protein
VDQGLVVKRDPKLPGELVADFSSAASEFSADGDHEIVHTASPLIK